MILSEFAGAAQSLNGSIVVNPWDSQQVADAIHEAVTMQPETRKENQRKLFKVRISIPPTLYFIFDVDAEYDCLCS
jgi:trehalose-6-phosphate synthase